MSRQGGGEGRDGDQPVVDGKIEHRVVGAPWRRRCAGGRRSGGVELREPGCFFPSLLWEVARWAGRMRRHSTNETIKTAMTTEGRTWKKRPFSPGTKSRGRKAMMLVATAKRTGHGHFLDPVDGGIHAGLPLEILWKMSSPTTTASSTTMPSVMMNPKSEIMLMVPPMSGRRTSEPMMETGMPMAVQNATRSSRRRPSAMSTNTSPAAPLTRRSSRRSRYSMERSRERVIPTDSGRVFWRDLLDEAPGGAGDSDGRLAVGAVDTDGDSAAPVEVVLPLGFFEAVDDFRDVAEADFGTVGGGEDGHLGKSLALSRRSWYAGGYRRRAEGAGGDVEGGALNGDRRHLAESGRGRGVRPAGFPRGSPRRAPRRRTMEISGSARRPSSSSRAKSTRVRSSSSP